jgi:hypothetical protein
VGSIPARWANFSINGLGSLSERSLSSALTSLRFRDEKTLAPLAVMPPLLQLPLYINVDNELGTFLTARGKSVLCFLQAQRSGNTYLSQGSQEVRNL